MPLPFAGFDDLPPVLRGFAYRKDTKSLQMSGKNSRLGSKDLAKGGLTPSTVKEMEKGHEEGKTFGESFYFSTGIKRNPLLVIYPVRLSYKPKEGEPVNNTKKKIVDTIDFQAIGLSIGIPVINGKPPQTIKYKINKRKWFELFGINEDEDYEETDETIPEE